MYYLNYRFDSSAFLIHIQEFVKFVSESFFFLVLEHSFINDCIFTSFIYLIFFFVENK